MILHNLLDTIRLPFHKQVDSHLQIHRDLFSHVSNITNDTIIFFGLVSRLLFQSKNETNAPHLRSQL